MNPRHRKSAIRETDAQCDGADFLASATSGDRSQSDLEGLDVARFADSDEPPTSEVLFI